MAKKKKKLTAKQRSARARKAWLKQWKTETEEQYKARIKKHRAKKRKEKTPEFKKRSEAAKRGWLTRKGWKKTPIETVSDIHENLITQIDRQFPKEIADKLKSVIDNYVSDVYGGDYNEYFSNIDLDKIAGDMGDDTSETYKTKNDLIKLFEDLTEGDRYDYFVDRAELSDLYDEYYIEWFSLKQYGA